MGMWFDKTPTFGLIGSWYSGAYPNEFLNYLQEGFFAENIELSSQQSNSNVYWNASARELYVTNYNITLHYSEDVNKVKFKKKDGSAIIVDLTKDSNWLTNEHGTELNVDSYHNGWRFVLLENKAIKLEVASSDTSFLFPYTYEISFYKNNVSYFCWDDKKWFPDQLQFSAGYLNENLTNMGSSSKLEEKNGNAYRYMFDKNSNMVYHKYLNEFARKTQINNGYRVNNIKTLELISFNNNIYDHGKKTGQFLFQGNKKQEYGISQQQNVPYFGGQPAIYPIVLYDNSNTIDDNPMSTLTLTVTSQLISFDNRTWKDFSADEDLLVAAIRYEGEWAAEKAPNWKIKRLSGESEVNMAGKNDTFYFEITDFTQKGTLTMKDFEFYEVEPGSYTVYQENKIEKMPFTKKIENSAIKNLYIIDNNKTWDSDIKYVSDHAVGKDSSGRTAGKNFKIFLGQYNDDKETWQDHLNLKMNFQVNNIRFIKPNSLEENLFYGSGEPSEKEGATGSQANNTCTAYVSWDIQNRTDSDNLNHDTGTAWSGTIEDFLAIGRIQRIFYAVPGSFPSFISYFPADDKKHIISHNTTSDKIEWYKTYSSQQHLNYDSQNDSNNSTSAYYNYKYRLQRGGGTYPNAWSVYLKVGYINNAYRPYALALILIKNGKLLNI